MAKQQTRVFSVQPRFRIGDVPNGWSLIEGVFHYGHGIPTYGSVYRDVHLAYLWQDEPMTAGVLSTWVEKAQTVNWKIVGSRNTANNYALMLHSCDGGDGWTYHEGVCALDYLTTDKGSFEELGRNVSGEVYQSLQEYQRVWSRGGHIADGRLDRRENYYFSPLEKERLDQLISRATFGRVTGIQHLDATRMIRIGLPSMRWRYYPEQYEASSLPDGNLIQIPSMPFGRDRYRGIGLCPLSRILTAKDLMLGYLVYFRQEIGDLPPELVAIINGLPQTSVEDSLRKYKADKEASGKDKYGKIWWLGTDDPATPIQFDVKSLTVPNKSFNYQTMVEWWIKVLSLNVGEDVGEFWLLQRGESKTVQSIQALKSKGKGVARYLQEKERRYNLDVMPYGARFEYDNRDDEEDQRKADILATRIKNLKEVASIGIDRQDPAYTMEEIRQLGIAWEVIPPEMVERDVPKAVGAVLKEIAGEDVWIVTRDFYEYPVVPLLKGKEQDDANMVYDYLKHIYAMDGAPHRNGHKVTEPEEEFVL